MRRSRGAALALGLLLGGCSSLGFDRDPSHGHMVKCPKPIHYTEKQHAEIEKAREALPANSILQQVLIDYENERDDLRFCK